MVGPLTRAGRQSRTAGACEKLGVGEGPASGDMVANQPGLAHNIPGGRGNPVADAH